MRLRVVVVILGLGATTTALARSPQGTPPSFAARTALVVIDVTVTDESGQAVDSLGRGDFTVLEDGVEQTITSFERVTVSAPSPPSRPSPVSTNAKPEPDSRRTVALLFDDLRMDPIEARKAAAAGAAVLDRLASGDVVVVATSSGTTFWTDTLPGGRPNLDFVLGRLRGRRVARPGSDGRGQMSELDAMRIHLQQDGAQKSATKRDSATAANPSALSSPLLEEGPRAPETRSLAAEIYAESASRTRTLLSVLEGVLGGLAHSKGRREVVLLSPGFPYDSSLTGFARVVSGAQRAQAALSFVDVRGLPSFGSGPEVQAVDLDRDSSGSRFEANIDATSGADHLASDTGGVSIRNHNDLPRAMRALTEQSSVYYLLGYAPTNAKADGRFRRTEVRLARPGLRARARRGYFAPGLPSRDAKKDAEDLRLVARAASMSALDLGTVPLRMASYAFEKTANGRVRVTVVLEALTSALLCGNERVPRGSFDLILAGVHRDTGETFEQAQTVQFKPASPGAAEWFSVFRELELQPGGYQIRALVRTCAANQIGTVTHTLEVPEANAFRTSTLVLTDALKQGQNSLDPRPTLLARREFKAGAIYCAFEVYGASADSGDAPPRILAELQLRRGNEVLAAPAPFEVVPEPSGRLSRLHGLTVSQPGEYQLLVSVENTRDGRTLTREETFTVIP